jgi:hypothetical protein
MSAHCLWSSSILSRGQLLILFFPIPFLISCFQDMSASIFKYVTIVYVYTIVYSV